VSSTRTTAPSATVATDPRRRPRPRRWPGVLAASAVCLGLAGCTSIPGSAAPATTGGPSSSASPALAAQALTLEVTIAGGDVTPNGEKVDVAVGQPVVLNVTSDEDDEIHAHTGGDGFELPVTAGEPTTGTFTLSSAGSFEVESHHLEKVIVVLDAR
jgi:hypothetical protein